MSWIQKTAASTYRCFMCYGIIMASLNNDRQTLQGRPTTIFGKYLFQRRFAIYNFQNICCKISCLPASPRIFEHLKNGIIAHF